jgi:hypothetical protein
MTYRSPVKRRAPIVSSSGAPSGALLGVTSLTFPELLAEIEGTAVR